MYVVDLIILLLYVNGVIYDFVTVSGQAVNFVNSDIENVSRNNNQRITIVFRTWEF